jgi:hypothetical protein
MSVVYQFTQQAEGAAERYDLLVASWRSLYDEYVNRSDFGSGKAINSMANVAYSLAHRYLDRENDLIDDGLYKIAIEAHRTTGNELRSVASSELPDAALELVNDTSEHLRNEIAIQIERDISQLKTTVRKTALYVNLSAQVQNTSKKSALIQHRMVHGGGVQFFFRDRQSNKWPSRRYVRTVWRDAALNLYNEIVMMTLADHGYDHAIVHHTNTSYHANGKKIALFDGAEMPTYHDVRMEVFHPNSDAILRSPD